LAGIYIHIPFCKQACHYCDFHFSTNLDRMSEMVDAICTELDLRKSYLGDSKIQTVYFGGGTPSLLSPDFLEKILDKIKSQYSCNWQEVTLEANPDDLTSENLNAWKALGIDRLSLGVQSFNEEVLKFYNRAHSAKESREAIQKARNAGFTKFSIDLIYGFPHQDHSIWESDLKTALELDPGHLSCYSLTVEPKTALGNWTKKGKFSPANENFVAEQFEMLQELTAQASYTQYEISNFGKAGQFAIHNTNYWNRVPYLGIGPSAHSFDGKNRGANPSTNIGYLKHLNRGEIPFQIENLDSEELLNEYILTGLRTIWGIDFDLIQKEFGIDLLQTKKDEITQMESLGLIVWKDNNLSLSKAGKLLADSIAERLFQ